jgi:hypothetical protein
MKDGGGKKGRQQLFSAEKNRKIYGGNRNINIKKMAGKHFPIGIGKKSEKMVSKKGAESGILRNSGGIPPEFPTKQPRTGLKFVHLPRDSPRDRNTSVQPRPYLELAVQHHFHRRPHEH